MFSISDGHGSERGLPCVFAAVAYTSENYRHTTHSERVYEGSTQRTRHTKAKGTGGKKFLVCSPRWERVGGEAGVHQRQVGREVRLLQVEVVRHHLLHLRASHRQNPNTCNKHTQSHTRNIRQRRRGEGGGGGQSAAPRPETKTRARGDQFVTGVLTDIFTYTKTKANRTQHSTAQHHRSR